jgi:hypothetical protein
MWHSYAQLAVHYYIAARFAAMQGYVPLCGNLMHHAIELLLKCGLIKGGVVPEGADADQHLRKNYGHRLGDLWTALKARHADAHLEEFDQLIATLDPWEEIRYPKGGIAMSVSRLELDQITKTAADATSVGIDGVKTYQLSIPTADRCMERLWTVISLNAEWFAMLVGDREKMGASIYEKDNRHVIYA